MAKKKAVKRNAPAKYVKVKPKAKTLKNLKGTKTKVTHKTSAVIKTKRSGWAIDQDNAIKTALPAGRRISSEGKVYYERRENRSDSQRGRKK